MNFDGRATSWFELAVSSVLLALAACAGNTNARESSDLAAPRIEAPSPTLVLDAPTTLTPAQRDAIDVLWRDSFPVFAKNYADEVPPGGWRAQPCRFRNRGLAELFPWWSSATDPASACEIEFGCGGTAELHVLDERTPHGAWCSLRIGVERGLTRIAWATAADRSRVGLVLTRFDGATFVREFSVPASSVPSPSERSVDLLHAQEWWLFEPGSKERLLQLWSWNGNGTAWLAQSWIEGATGGMNPVPPAVAQKEMGVSGPVEGWSRPVWAVTLAFAPKPKR